MKRQLLLSLILGLFVAVFGDQRRVWVLFVILLLGCCWTLGADGDDKKVTAVYIEGEIIVDGDLDEPEWSLAQPATDFIQNEPRTGQPATERTEVRFLYNNENLYVGLWAFDSAGRSGIRVHEVKRDYSPWENDNFAIMLDTFNDDRNGFLFNINPRGGKRDTQIGGDGTVANTDWDTIWYAKSKITESGWQAEIAIPFKSLRFKEGEEQVWGVNLLRRIRRKAEDAHWSPVPRPWGVSRVSEGGELNGIKGIRQGHNLILKPYLSMPIVRREADDVDFVPEVGLDAKYGLTPGLTLDLTVNTDFAQVEADDQQINLTRFSLFFPEKRDFFLENAGIFEFRSNRDLIPFFTRRIGLSSGRVVPIFGGARLTGRVGKYVLGLFTMQTQELEETPSTNFSVARIRRDILVNSEVGGIFINKQENGGDFNRTYGLDANLKFGFLDIASFVLNTDSPGIEGDDKAARVRVAYQDRFWDVQGEYLLIEKDFNPEVGFAPRRGIRKSRGRFGIKPRPGERIPSVRDFRPSVAIDYITNEENILETRIVDSRFAVLFQDISYLVFSHKTIFERLDEPFFIRPTQSIPIGDYDFNEFSAFFASDPSRMFGGNAFVSTGGFFDGDKDTYSLGFHLQPGYHFRADVTWSHDDVSLPSGDFTTQLVNTRLNYSFTPSVFLNTLIQYNSTRREISSNIRFNFIYKPLSDFFLVYNERRSTTGEVRERALIAKVTYVLDF